MPRREFKGASIPTRLTAGIGAGDTSFNINNNAGWPTGGANGAFYVTLDPDTADEERVLVGSQAGGLCSSVTRGVDNTTAKSHSVGADGTAIHSSAAVDYDEANRHIFVTTDDNHTQYMLTAGGRHDLTARHSAGSVVPTATAGAATVGGSAAEGSGVNLARATHTHGFATGTPVSIGTSNQAGVSGSFPRLDHQHELGSGSIDAAALFAAGVVDSNALGAAAVIAGKIAAGGVSASNQIANSILTQLMFSLENPTSYAPPITDFSDGAGGAFVGGTGHTTYGYYYKFGRLVIGWAGFSMAADGNLPSGSDIRIPLPFTQASLTTFRPVCAARARLASSLATYASGLGIIVAGGTDGTNIATAGANAEWDATHPWNWGTPGEGFGATVDSFFAMISTT